MEFVDNDWRPLLAAEFGESYMKELESFLDGAYASGTVYPPRDQLFEAFRLTPYEEVKVVILGQDPYHGPRQAHGLSFSVGEGIALPPSLRNIFKELEADLKVQTSEKGGNLAGWARQGVLLLNTTLTVEGGKPLAHAKKGWEKFTDKVLQLVNEKEQPVVFILWGKHAQKKGDFLDRGKHLVLESVHPSPLSARRGFFGSRPFSQTNDFLANHGVSPVDWSR